MRYLILLLCLIASLKVANGQTCDLSGVINTFENIPKIIKVGGFGEEIRMRVTFTTQSNMGQCVDLVNTAIESGGFETWGRAKTFNYTGELEGILSLEIFENPTDEPRLLVLQAAINGCGIQQEAPYRKLKIFQVTHAGKKVLPGVFESTVSLDNSEVGITYTLKKDNSPVNSQTGTGKTLLFKVDRKGLYTIEASDAVGSAPMKGEADVQGYLLSTKKFHFESLSDTMDSEGGYIAVLLRVENGTDLKYAQEIREIIKGYNDGLTACSWDRTVSIFVQSSAVDGSHNIGFYAPLNIDDHEKRYVFALDDDVPEHSFTIVHKGGGKIKAYHLSGPQTINPGENFVLKLSDFQNDVVYEVTKDDETIDSFTGSNTYTCSGGPGVYKVYACYQNHRVPMINSWKVLEKGLYSHHLLTRTYYTSEEAVEDVTYYDNLGRPLQVVNTGASPSGQDIIQPIVYNEQGKVSRTYLPYASSGNSKGGILRKNFLQEQSAFYNTLYGANAYAYSDVVYDNSPKDQVIEQSSPGASWRMGGGHTMRTSTRKNTAEDHIKRCMSENSSIFLIGDYPAGSLSVKQKIDPENKESYEYYDSEGHLIAKESRISASERYITYYVYNIAGRLSHIVPPALTKQIMVEGAAYVEKKWTDLSKYCYYMEYDKYGNIYKQYVSGAGYTINLYDKRGRLVLSQNSVMRSKTPEEWAFTKYDILNRPVLSGVCNGTEAAHTSALAAQTVFGEERGSALHGYTNQTYPTAVTASRCLNITYYDDYTWSGNNNVSFSTADALGQEKSDDVKGQTTGRKTKVLGIATDQWLMSAIYYDSRYRTIQEVSQLYPSGTDVTTNVPDYVGNVTQVKVTQTVGSQTTEYNKYYSYDHRGRLLKVEQQMTGDPQGKVTLASYTYDELGRQTGKKLHNNSYATTYAYQVGGNLSTFHSKDLTYMLSYDTLAVPASGAVAKYDGNISCLRWKNNNTPFKSYTYAYDALGQLTNALYNEQSGSTWSNPSSKFNVSGIGYDQNGNLKSLIRRNSSGDVLHNLVYNYDLADNGNALSSVTLNGSASGAFVYDANGNLVTDGQRGINIRYNELNLPEEISKGSEKISYIYSASGEKLAMQAGSSLTYYRDVMVYNGNTLSYVLHPEGIIRRSGTAWVYDYMLPDHTGSTRVLLEANGNTLSAVQTTDYYPFGLSFANNNLDKNKYLFSGKELQDGMLGGSMLGWYDFGARMYNPVLGRWFCQDPALQLVSPYGFCGNNPVCYIDSDGKFFLGFAAGFIRGLFKGRPFKEAWRSAINQEKITFGLLFRPSPHQNGFKQFAEILSRFTWQLPQTLLGYGVSQTINLGASTKVDFYDGVTTISSSWFHGKEAMTLGNFINGSNELEADPNSVPFQHEFGHYLQSKKMGWAYLSKVGIPSILSAGGDGEHRYYPVEQDANARAIKYFNEKGMLKKWNFNIFPIGAGSWNMDNIYKEGTKEFTNAFDNALKTVKSSPSFWDYLTFGISPGILIVGDINHHKNKRDSDTVK